MFGFNIYLIIAGLIGALSFIATIRWKIRSNAFREAQNKRLRGELKTRQANDNKIKDARNARSNVVSSELRNDPNNRDRK